MMQWLFIYAACGVLFTTVILIRNWQKDSSQSLVSDIRRIFVKNKAISDRIVEIIGNSFALISVSALWVLFLCWLVYEKYFQKMNDEIDEKQRFNATKEFLICIIDPEAEEKKHIIHDPLGRVPEVPFGHLHHAWIKFLANTEPDDLIWSYKIKVGDLITPWYSKQKRPSSRSIKGYACLRDGDVVNEFIYETS